MEFKNRPNQPVTLPNGNVAWISRSVAVAGPVVAFDHSTKQMYVLASKRGPRAADNHGLMNLVCGYLDWDETGPEAFMREVYEETGLDIQHILEIYEILIENLRQPWHVVTGSLENRQNVTLRYGFIFAIDDVSDLPKLTTEHNEVVGEVEDPIWMPYEDRSNYEWAYNHNKVIEVYVVQSLLKLRMREVQELRNIPFKCPFAPLSCEYVDTSTATLDGHCDTCGHNPKNF